MIPFAEHMAAFGGDIPSLAVAVSGGADSMALALLAAEWASAKGIPFQAFTVDHRLRADSSSEAAQVHAWLSDHNITHRILTWEHAEAPTANLQSQARDARYALLADACREAGISHLLLGHHQDDQAETLLIRLQRGSGVDGLSAMRAVSHQHGITLLRPLLDVPKSALIEYLASRNQPWVEDPSNRAEKHTRVKMRKALAETGISTANLAATAARMARASDYLREQTALARDACLLLHDEGFITLKLADFKALHPEIALRVLADALRLMNHDAYRPRFSELEAVYYALPEARTLAGCRFIPKKNDVLIIRELAHIAPKTPLLLNIPLIWDGRFEVTALQQGLSITHAGVDLPEGTTLPKAILHSCLAIIGLENTRHLPHMHTDAGKTGEFPFIIRAFPLRGKGLL